MNYSQSIDLLKFVGAQVASVKIQGKKRNCIIIPAEWNEITITQDDQGRPSGAWSNLRNWEASKNYVQACKENHKEDENYRAPSHQTAIGYSQEFREKAEKAAYERLAKDPQHAGKPEDELKKMARYAVNDKTRIGTMTALEPKQPQAFTGQATAVGTTDWVPPTVDENGNVMPGDDLPF